MWIIVEQPYKHPYAHTKGMHRKLRLYSSDLLFSEFRVKEIYHLFARNILMKHKEKHFAKIIEHLYNTSFTEKEKPVVPCPENWSQMVQLPWS